MFGGTAKINPGLPPGSPLRVRTKDPANPQGNGDIDVSCSAYSVLRELLLSSFAGLGVELVPAKGPVRAL